MTVANKYKTPSEEEYHEMSNKDKIITLCHEVIRLTQLEPFKVKSNSNYLCFLRKEDSSLRGSYGISMYNLMKHSNQIEECHVCAKGSLFVSHFQFYKNYEIKTISLSEFYQFKNPQQRKPFIPDYNGDDIDIYENKELISIFGDLQWELIEVAFEKKHPYGTELDVDMFGAEDEEQLEIGINQLNAAVTFGEQYQDDTERLIAIMNNIIENDGIFKP